MDSEVVSDITQKFGRKFADLKATITLDKPGVYDYEKVMHNWTGGGGCRYLSTKPSALIIASDNVTVKNLGINNAIVGITFEGKEQFENIKFINVEVYACYQALGLPDRIFGLETKDSRFVTVDE